MKFQQALSSYFRNYFNYRDRASRAEFWLPQIVMFPLGIALSGMETFAPGFLSIAAWLVSLAVIGLPGLSLSVRRFHDLDKSGWWLLIGLIPVVGAIIVIVFFCMEGSQHANRFGPQDPAARFG